MKQQCNEASLSQHDPGVICPVIASDIMTRNVYTIHPEASAQEVARLLSQEHSSGAPVVDAHGKVIGIVSEADSISKENHLV